MNPACASGKKKMKRNTRNFRPLRAKVIQHVGDVGIFNLSIWRLEFVFPFECLLKQYRLFGHIGYAGIFS